MAKSIRLYDTEKGNFSAWIWQIVRNTFTDHLRSRGRKPENSASHFDIDPDSFAATNSYGDDEEMQRLMDILGKFPEEDRELFQMRSIAGLSYQEIEDITGRTINALTVATHRIREKLKKDLYEEPI